MQHTNSVVTTDKVQTVKLTQAVRHIAMSVCHVMTLFSTGWSIKTWHFTFVHHAQNK